MMIRSVIALALALVAAPQAFAAKSFGEYCLSPETDAQIHTVHRMLRAVGLPPERTPTICRAGTEKLMRTQKLVFKYITARVPNSFETVVVEPITDLRPLEGVSWLTALELEGPTIGRAFEGHNPLAGVPYLEELKIVGVPLRTLSSLAAVPRLRSLVLNNVQVKDVSALERLTSLTKVDLSSNEIIDFSVLAKLPLLTELVFKAGRTTEQLPSLDFVAPLKGLRTLRLTGHKIKYLTVLEGLKELRALDLYANRIMDVEPIVGLTKLVELNLGSNNIHDISLLRRLTALETLSLHVNHIVSAAALEDLVNLRSVELSGNPLEYLRLHKLLKLEHLRAVACKITDLWGVPENGALKTLDLSHNKLKSLDRMAFMPALESAIFYQNEISEIWQLASGSAKRLRHLSLTRNKVDTVEALKGYLDLEQLNIEENPVKDFTPLAELQKEHRNSEGRLIQLHIWR